jgi:drug/metabolite transporter (DMT)-like permease
MPLFMTRPDAGLNQATARHAQSEPSETKVGGGPPIMHGRFADRMLLLAVAVIWGLNWPSVKFALQGFSIWTFRTMSFGGAALILMLAARSIGASLRVEKTVDRLHLAVAGLFNTAGFGVLTAMAMLNTSTGRTAICAYTMPIWATLLGRIVLGERLTASRMVSLTLGSAGLLVLLWPLVATGIPIGAILAIGSAISWAVGTVYQKWAGVRAHPLAIAVWQLVAGTVAAAIGVLFTGIGPWTDVGAIPLAALVYTTVSGTAVAYLLWFRIVQRLPAGTAGLGTLLVPVVGVIASAVLLGERPTGADLVGFALVFVAALVALRPDPRAVETRELGA